MRVFASFSGLICYKGLSHCTCRGQEMQAERCVVRRGRSTPSSSAHAFPLVATVRVTQRRPKPEAASGWLTRQHIAALRLDLDPWVRAALSTHLNHIARLVQIAFHLSALKEGKIERDLLVPQRVYVLRLLPSVKREQRQATWLKHTSPFTQDSDDL